MIGDGGYDGYDDSSTNPNNDRAVNRAVKWLARVDTVASMTREVGGKKVGFFHGGIF